MRVIDGLIYSSAFSFQIEYNTINFSTFIVCAILFVRFTYSALRSPRRTIETGLLFAIAYNFRSRLSDDVSSPSRFCFRDIYRGKKLHILSPFLISKFVDSCRKWISNILKKRNFRKENSKSVTCSNWLYGIVLLDYIAEYPN